MTETLAYTRPVQTQLLTEIAGIGPAVQELPSQSSNTTLHVLMTLLAACLQKLSSATSYKGYDCVAVGWEYSWARDEFASLLRW